MMSCNTKEIPSLEVNDSVKFDVLQGVEFEQALRGFLREYQDKKELGADDIAVPVQIPVTELLGVSGKSRVSQRAAKVSKNGRSVTPPPGLENPMKIRSELVAPKLDDWEIAGTQWHKQVPQHVHIANEPSATSPTRKPRFCTQCGQKVEDKLAMARFCTFCGSEHPNMDAIYQQAGLEQSTNSQFEGADTWSGFMVGTQPPMGNCNISPWDYDGYCGGSVFEGGAMYQSNAQCLAR